MDTREQWLNAAGAILLEEVIEPVTDIETPLIRYSLTAPKSTLKKGSVLGECWSRAASLDGANEIFITANLGETDSVTILSVLIHEQIHAFDDNQNGHKGPFIDLCKRVGLKGGATARAKHSYTATEPTGPLLKLLEGIVEDLGPIPHAAMSPELSGKKVQKNRQLLVACSLCDFKFRASKKVIDSIKYDSCLACDDGILTNQP